MQERGIQIRLPLSKHKFKFSICSRLKVSKMGKIPIEDNSLFKLLILF